MHHSCRHVVNDIDHPFLGQLEKKPTFAGMGYDGNYRCLECKRRVRVDVDDPETYARDSECAPRVEPPYPEGFC